MSMQEVAQEQAHNRPSLRDDLLFIAKMGALVGALVGVTELTISHHGYSHPRHHHQHVTNDFPAAPPAATTDVAPAATPTQY